MLHNQPEYTENIDLNVEACYVSCNAICIFYLPRQHLNSYTNCQELKQVILILK